MNAQNWSDSNFWNDLVWGKIAFKYCATEFYDNKNRPNSGSKWTSIIIIMNWISHNINNWSFSRIVTYFKTIYSDESESLKARIPCFQKSYWTIWSGIRGTSGRFVCLPLLLIVLNNLKLYSLISLFNQSIIHSNSSVGWLNHNSFPRWSTQLIEFVIESYLLANNNP